MNMTDEVTAQLVEIFERTYKDLEPEARDAIVVKIVERVNRLSAERDGWRAIATELLKVAFGDDNVLGEAEHPPLELIELHEVGRLPGKFVPALAQFWADLTAKHARERAARQRRIDERIESDHLDDWDLGRDEGEGDDEDDEE